MKAFACSVSISNASIVADGCPPLICGARLIKVLERTLNATCAQSSIVDSVHNTVSFEAMPEMAAVPAKTLR